MNLDRRANDRMSDMFVDHPSRPLRLLCALCGKELVFLIREEFADFGEELARAEGFGDIAVAAGGMGLRLVAGERIRGDGDDRHLRQLGSGADLTCRLV